MRKEGPDPVVELTGAARAGYGRGRRGRRDPRRRGGDGRGGRDGRRCAAARGGRVAGDGDGGGGRSGKKDAGRRPGDARRLGLGGPVWASLAGGGEVGVGHLVPADWPEAAAGFVRW